VVREKFRKPLSGLANLSKSPDKICKILREFWQMPSQIDASIGCSLELARQQRLNDSIQDAASFNPASNRSRAEPAPPIVTRDLFEALKDSSLFSLRFRIVR